MFWGGCGLIWLVTATKRTLGLREMWFFGRGVGVGARCGTAGFS